MWPALPYKNTLEASLPNARLVIDKFHVVHMTSDALEAERKRPKSLSLTELRALDAVRANYMALALAYDL
jgi:transposase